MNITMELVQKRMGLNPLLSHLSVSRIRMKQVVNYINHQVRKEKGTTPPPADQPAVQTKVSNWLDNFDEPSARSSSSRRTEWDDNDTRRLEKAFSKHTKLLSTATIHAIMDNDPELSIIKQREGWTCLYSKVKNLFKKKVMPVTTVVFFEEMSCI